MCALISFVDYFQKLHSDSSSSSDSDNDDEDVNLKTTTAMVSHNDFYPLKHD